MSLGEEFCINRKSLQGFVNVIKPFKQALIDQTLIQSAIVLMTDFKQ